MWDIQVALNPNCCLPWSTSLSCLSQSAREYDTTFQHDLSVMGSG